MDIKTQLNESMKDAMRSGDTVRKNTVRMALAAIKQVEVDKRTELDELTIIALLQKEIKNRKEAIEEAITAGRDDLVSDNQAEIAVLEVFLPEAMSRRIARDRVGCHRRDRRVRTRRHGKGHEGGAGKGGRPGPRRRSQRDRKRVANWLIDGFCSD